MRRASGLKVLPDDILKSIFTYLQPYRLVCVPSVFSPLLPDVIEKHLCPIPLVCKRWNTVYIDLVCLFCRVGMYTKMVVTTVKCNTCGHLIRRGVSNASISTLIKTRRKRRKLGFE